jgi:hypothetical protein
MPTGRVVHLAALGALATPVATLAAPLYDYFGPLNEATFGGTGIPNDYVAVASQFEDGNNLITVALAASQRYGNPALTNDGAGTFFATTGANTLGAPLGAPLGATWNWNYFIKVEGLNGATPILADYDITLFYDFNPALDNGPSGLGRINITNGILGSSTPAATLVEGSQNLLFGFLATALPGLVTPPTSGGFTTFNPNATGEYNFAIQVSRDGWGVENVRMDVQVVPVPAAAWLFGGALGALGWLRRRHG